MKNLELIHEFGKLAEIDSLDFDDDGLLILSADDDFTVLINDISENELGVRIVLCQMVSDEIEKYASLLLNSNMKLINCGGYVYWDEETSELGISKIISSTDITALQLSILIEIILDEAEKIKEQMHTRNKSAYA